MTTIFPWSRRQHAAVRSRSAWWRILALALVTAFGCERPLPISRLEWPEMGTVAALQIRGERDAMAFEAVRGAFAEVTDKLNAHDSGSELNLLAAKDEATILARCNGRMRPCYEAAFRLREQTGGLFNPRYRGPGTMDLGAIAKGFAVDLGYERLKDGRQQGRFLIDLGGNLRASGEWLVGIAGSDETLTLHDGEACATSGEYFRGAHIRNGRTGDAISNAVYSVTVVHPCSAMLADGLSTVMFLLGRTRGEAFLRRHYPEARAIWIAAENHAHRCP